MAGDPQHGRTFVLTPLWVENGHSIKVAEHGRTKCRRCEQPIRKGTQMLPGRYHGTRSQGLCFICATRGNVQATSESPYESAAHTDGTSFDRARPP